jgi:hypothetical protein
MQKDGQPSVKTATDHPSEVANTAPLQKQMLATTVPSTRAQKAASPSSQPKNIQLTGSMTLPPKVPQTTENQASSPLLSQGFITQPTERTPAKPTSPALSALPATTMPGDARQMLKATTPDQLPSIPLLTLAPQERILPLAPSSTLFNKKTTGQWYHDISIRLAQPVRHFNNSTTNLQNKKEQEESLREVVTAGYLIGFRHSSGLYAQAGLQLQQRREYLQWQGIIDSSAVSRNINQAYFFFDQSGQAAYRSGEREATQITRRFITQQNYYRMINVPLQIGYTYQYQRWAGFAEAGVTLNLLHTFSGKFIDANHQVQEQQTVNQEILQRNLGLGWSAGLGVAYQLRPKIDIYLKADYQQFRQSIHQGQGYQQWYGNWGIAVGLRRGF